MAERLRHIGKMRETETKKTHNRVEQWNLSARGLLETNWIVTGGNKSEGEYVCLTF